MERDNSFFNNKECVGYTEQSDMEKWLRLNSFRVSADEIEIGDILVLRDGFELIHTAVLVKIENGDRFFWHKPGIAYGWTLDSYKSIEEIYGDHINGIYWHRAGAVITKVV